MKSLRKIFSKSSRKKDNKSSVEKPEEDDATKLARLMNSGRSKLRSNQYSQAIDDFGEVVKLAPLYGIVYFDRGTAFHLNGDNKEALRDFDIAIALLPDTSMERVVAYHNRGLVNEGLDNLGEAMRNLEISNKAGFPSSATELERIRSQYDENDVTNDQIPDLNLMCDQARSAYSANPLLSLVLFCKASEYYPDSVDAFYGQGIANVALSRMSEAIKVFTVVIDSNPPKGMLGEALYNRGSILKNLGEYELAIEDLEKALNFAEDKNVDFPVLGDSEKEEALIQSMKVNLEQTKEAFKHQ